MHFSLDMVRGDCISHFIVENDSKLLINLITENHAIGRGIPTLVWCIHNLLTLHWKVQVCHLGGRETKVLILLLVIISL